MSDVISKRKRYSKWHIDLAIHEAVSVARRRSHAPAFEQLLRLAVSRSDLIRPTQVGGYAAFGCADRFLPALLVLAENERNWIRDACTWECSRGSSPLEQFRGMAHHLLAKRAPPNFMTSVWFEQRSAESLRHQRLYKHLALGNSIRGASVPIRLTKGAADWFYKAPDHLSVEQALRWSQVRGLGGEPRLAAAVAASRLGEDFENNSFWEDFLGVLSRQQSLDLSLIHPMIEFLVDRRVDSSKRLHRIVPGERISSFVNRVRKWMRTNPSYRLSQRTRWARSTIGGFRYSEPSRHPWSVKYWTIRELTTSAELHDEGNGLHHCVGSYAQACERGWTTIWSMCSHGAMTRNRALTIQVDPYRRTIVTALGRCNAPPTPESIAILKRWAFQEGLRIGR